MGAMASESVRRPVRQQLTWVAEDQVASVPLVNWLLLVASWASAGLLLLALVGLWLSMTH